MNKPENKNPLESKQKKEDNIKLRKINASEPMSENPSTFTFVESVDDRSIAVTIDIAERIEKSNFPPEQKKQLRERLRVAFKKIFSVVSFATVVLGSAAVADYRLTRYKVESKSSGNGEITYTHEDQKTTHIINVLAGKERLNEDEKREILDSLKNEGDTDVSIDDMLLKVSPGGSDQELYEALWNLETECGNPKIRLTYGRHDMEKFGIICHLEPGTSFYHPATNTAYLNLKGWQSITHKYIAELSHGKQYKENPAPTTLVGIMDYAKTVKRYALGDEHREDYRNLKDSYARLYQEPGTVEYEAHKTIEPQLKSRLEQLTPQKTAREKEELGRKKLAYQKQITEIEQEKEKVFLSLLDSQAIEIQNMIINSKEQNTNILQEKIDSIKEEYSKKMSVSAEKFNKKIDDIK
ncbi:MAG: hypothetical protein WC870_03135 [Candidatus Paceibacterota bacterium]